MATGGEIDEDEKPIGELFGQLIDEGKAYARAELGLAKASAEAKADELKWPAILIFSALLFAQAAGTVAAVTIALALATLIGPLAGGIIAILLAAGAAYLLYAAGMARLKAAAK
jgi:small ligand-binding sensory domain FIST